MTNIFCHYQPSLKSESEPDRCFYAKGKRRNSDINDESIKREATCRVYRNNRDTFDAFESFLMVGGNYVFTVRIVSIAFDFSRYSHANFIITNTRSLQHITSTKILAFVAALVFVLVALS